MSETKVVSMGIAIALGVTSILLLIGLAAALVYFPAVVSDKDTIIQTLTLQRDQLGLWLDGNTTLLQAALTERGSIEAKLDDPKSGLPGIQSNFTSVLAALNASQAKPLLDVRVIAEDDPTRNTGIMVLGILPPSVTPGSAGFQAGSDLIAHYKITMTYNGIPITPSGVMMQVLMKTVTNPSSKQFPAESLASELTDVSDKFVLIYRSAAPGVGVLDVYYVGPLDKEYVANYMLVIVAFSRIGRSVVYGTDLQSLCVLGWSMDSTTGVITLPDGSKYYGWWNPLGAFTSCDEAAFVQRIWLGLPIPQG